MNPGITSKDILNKHLLSTQMNPTSYGSLVSQTFAPNQTIETPMKMARPAAMDGLKRSQQNKGESSLLSDSLKKNLESTKVDEEE